MDALVAEVASLRAQLQQLRTSRKEPCQGVTGKGTPCRNGALPGTPHCRMHSREPKVPKPTRPRKEPKPKKTIPEHTHDIGDTDPMCPLCQTHGDCMDAPHSLITVLRVPPQIMCVPIVCGGDRERLIRTIAQIGNGLVLIDCVMRKILR